MMYNKLSIHQKINAKGNRRVFYHSSNDKLAKCSMVAVPKNDSNMYLSDKLFLKSQYQTHTH